MIVAFVTILIICSELNYSLAANTNIGINPYPAGSSMLTVFNNLVLFITCVRYLGWIWGIIVFLCSFFSIVHLTIGWILSVRTLFFKHDWQVLKKARLEAILAPYLLLILIAFCVVSFFATPFRSLSLYLRNHIDILVIAVIVLIVSAVVRVVIAKYVESSPSV
jgi:hypothetical protein